MSTWKFQSICDERIQELVKPTTIDVILERVTADMEVLCFHRQPCDDNRHFSRVVWCLRVFPCLFDSFFNSQYGYRGAYYRSPYAGLDVNHLFIGRLSQALLDWAESHCAELDRAFAAESLGSPSAKVWLAEHGPVSCKHCTGEWGSPQDDKAEILNGRWEHEDCPNARSGRKAPRGSKLKIFGAFLDDRHNEFVPERKRHRAVHIHRWGWS
jgi:hypothetical protein